CVAVWSRREFIQSLFPYTTLFRCWRRGPGRRTLRGRRDGHEARRRWPGPSGVSGLGPSGSAALAPVGRGLTGDAGIVGLIGSRLRFVLASPAGQDRSPRRGRAGGAVRALAVPDDGPAGHRGDDHTARARPSPRRQALLRPAVLRRRAVLRVLAARAVTGH